MILNLDLTYDLKKDFFKLETNARDPENVIMNYLGMQMGKGEDHNKAIERDIYHINIKLDFTQDTFTSTNDCGNKGLRDGILLRYLAKKKEPVKK